MSITTNIGNFFNNLSLGEDVLSLILNNKVLNQNLIALVSTCASDIVKHKASLFVRLAHQQQLVLYHVNKELTSYIERYDYTTIYYMNTEFYIEPVSWPTGIVDDY